MSIIYSTVVANITADKLRRVCHSCKREQFVALEKLTDVVKCKFCDKEIPPKKREALQTTDNH